MVDFQLSPDQQGWVEKAKKLSKEFATRARGYDERGQYTPENMTILREEGFLKLAVPREYGGLGTKAGWCAFLPHLVLEEIAAGCGNTGWNLLTHFHHCGLLAGLGSEEQCARIFADVVNKGSLMGSLGSEVNPQQMTAAASVGQRIKFEAGFEPVPGGFRANAVKGFCSLSPVADYLFYWALAPGTTGNADGLTISIVRRDSPGLTFLSGWEESIGLRASLSGGAKLENVFIPWKNVMGEPGDWVQKHPWTFEITYAVELLGIAQGAYDFVLKLVRERPYLQKDDTVVYTIGEMSSELHGARMAWWYAQWLWDQKQFDDAAHASMRALHLAKKTAMFVTTNAFDVCGVRAVFKFNPLERAWRDVRVVTLHTRESQLMRLLAEGEISGQRFTKEKYGPRLEHRKTWHDLGIDREPSESSGAPAQAVSGST